MLVWLNDTEVGLTELDKTKNGLLRAVLKMTNYYIVIIIIIIIIPC